MFKNMSLIGKTCFIGVVVIDKITRSPIKIAKKLIKKLKKDNG